MNSYLYIICSVHAGTIDQTTGDIISTTQGPQGSLVTITGDHGKYWNLERFTMQAPADRYKLVFSAKNGNIKINTYNAKLFVCGQYKVMLKGNF